MTLCVGMHCKTLCVQVDAERQSMHYHAERGNDQLCECVLPNTAKEFSFTTASQQIVGQAGLLRLRQNQRRAVILFLVLVLILLFMRERSDTTKRDLGAGTGGTRAKPGA